MDLAKYTKLAEKMIVDNSPLLLTAVGVVGTATTAYLTGKASFKAAKLIADAQFKENITDKGHPLTNGEKTKLVWKQFVLPAGVGTLTCAAIIGSNRVSTRRMAALAAGYSLLDNRFDEYKKKALEKLGVKKEDEMRSELAEGRVNDNPPPSSLVILEGKTMFRDEVTGRYFESTMEDIKRAQNDVNYKILSDEYAVLSDFFERIGLPPTSISEEFGWYLDSRNKFDILFNSIIHEGKPIITIDYPIDPIRGGSPNRSSQKLQAL